MDAMRFSQCAEQACFMRAAGSSMRRPQLHMHPAIARWQRTPSHQPVYSTLPAKPRALLLLVLLLEAMLHSSCAIAALLSHACWHQPQGH